MNNENGWAGRVSWSPDGKTLATGSSGNMVKLWSKNGALIETLRGQVGMALGVSWSPDGSTLAIGTSRGEVTYHSLQKLWDK